MFGPQVNGGMYTVRYHSNSTCTLYIKMGGGGAVRASLSSIQLVG
jgi:hypothetical protein